MGRKMTHGVTGRKKKISMIVPGLDHKGLNSKKKKKLKKS